MSRRLNSRFNNKIKFSRILFALTVMAGLFVVTAGSVITTPQAHAAAGTNQQLNYQGRLLTASGAVVADGTYNMEFKIYQDGPGNVAGDTGGTLKWTEDWVYGVNTPDNRITVRNGYFSVSLGSICTFASTTCTASTGNSQTNAIIDWNQDTLWLSINIGNVTTAATFAGASGDGEMLPMRRMSSSVYALNSNKVGGLTASQLVQLSPGSQQTGSINISSTLTAGGAINGLTLSASSLAAATAATNLAVDAGTTGQVQVGGVSTGDILLGGGSASTGCTLTNSTGAFACTSTLNGLTVSATNLAVVTAATSLTIDAGTTGQVQIGGVSTGDILLGGGSASTGCTITNASGNLTCTAVMQSATAVHTGANALTLGTSSSQIGQIVFRESGGANTVTLNAPASTAGNYTLTIPTITANDTLCAATLSNCTAAGSAGGALTGTYPSPILAGITTTGAIPFQGASSGVLTSDAANFFWDNTSKRLGIGTNAPLTDIMFGQSANRTISVGVSTGTTGANLSVLSGAGNTTGVGGVLTLQSGAGGATGAGGALTVQGGTGGATSGAGGIVTIQGGNAAAGASNGGGVSILGGASTTTGVASPITITAGAGVAASNIAGGVLNITSGAGGGTAAGGLLTVKGGAGGATGAGGALTVQGGTGGATSGAGGLVTIQGGNATAGASNGGGVSILGGASTTTGVAAPIIITAGAGIAASNIAGGTLTVTSGAGGGTAAGGLLTLQGGQGGATGVGGAVILHGGAGGATSGAGGALTLSAGDATTSGAGGVTTITGGAGVGTNMAGGNVTISPGVRTGTGTLGSVIVKPQTSNDTTTAFQVQNAAGSAIFNVDTTNSIIGTPATTTASTNSNQLTVSTGSVSGASSTSGALTITTGNIAGTSSQVVGAITIQPGTPGVGSAVVNTASGASVNIYGGAGGNQTSDPDGGNGGNINIVAGTAGNTGGAGAAGLGGNISITGGISPGSFGGGNIFIMGGHDSASISGNIIVQSNTYNSQTAFQIQKAAGTSIFTADTVNSKILIAGALDTITGTTLSVGATTATALTLGRTGITTTNAGALTVTQLLTATTDLTFTQGANHTISVATSTGTTGYNLSLLSGGGNTTGAGGLLTLQGGQGGATGVGGAVILHGGAGGATSGAGGALTLSAGDATTSGAGGATTITGGNGVGTNMAGGNVTISPGVRTGTGTLGSVIVKPQASNDSTNIFTVQTASGASVLTVDTLSFSGSASYVINNGISNNANELANGTFEPKANSNADSGWWINGTSVNAVTDAANARTGNRELQITAASTDAGESKMHPVQPGDQIYYEGYVKRSAGGGGTGGFYMEAYDKDMLNPVFSGSDVWTDPGTTYTLRTGIYTVPAGKYFVNMNVTTRVGATGTWYYDDLYMHIATEKTPMVFRNSTNTTTAFQVQNAAGSAIFNVDTTNSKIGSPITSTASTNSNQLTVSTGNATGTTSNSGTLTVTTGSATGTAGILNLTSGVGASTSGAINLFTGAGSGGSGALNLYTSSVPAGGLPGDVTIQGGSTADTSSPDNFNGASVNIFAGSGGNVTTGTALAGGGGNINIIAGTGGSDNGCMCGNDANGGSVIIKGGNGASATAGVGGVVLMGGYNYNGGSGSVTVRGNKVDSSGAFAVQNVAGTTSIFNVDTINQTVKVQAIAASDGTSTILGDFNGTFPGTGWTTGGTANWVADGTTKQEGAFSARSGAIGDNQSSWISYTYNATVDGTLKYYWKTSSENGYDHLNFCYDNNSCTNAGGAYNQISGTVGFVEVSVPVTAGTHTFRWQYDKDTGSIGGTDQAWLDNVRFVVKNKPAALTVQDSTNTLSMFNINAMGQAVFTNLANATNAFQIQNSTGYSGLTIDTVGDNLIANGDFESNTTDWAIDGATTLATDATNFQINHKSMSITTPATANTGTKTSVFSSGLVAYTSYVLSAWIKGSSAGNFAMGIAKDGSTKTSCTTNTDNGSTASSFTTSWVHYYCVLSQGSLTNTPYVYIDQTDTTARTLYIDGVLLKKGDSYSTKNWGDINLTVNGTEELNGALYINTTSSWNAYPLTINNPNGQVAWFDGNGNLTLNTTITTRGGSSSSNMIFTSGDASAGNSGDVNIRSGTATGTRGNINIGSSSASTLTTNIDANKTGYALTVTNSSTATSAGTPASSSDGILIKIATANASRTTGNYFAAFSDGSTVAGKIQGGASAVAYTTTGADYAEYFKTDSANLPVAGEIVMTNTTANQSVLKSGVSTTNLLVGIVSSNPGFIGNGPLCNIDDNDCETNFNKYNALVALSGQVPAKVNTTNGPIAIGDPITASSITGEGAKANGAGYIVGYAQEPLTTGSGTIKVLVRPQHYTPSMQQALQATSLTVAGETQLQGSAQIAGNLNVAGHTTLTSLTVTGNATFTGNLTVQNITVANITINGHIVTKGSTPVATLDSAIPALENITVGIEGNDSAGTITITTPTTLITPVTNSKLLSVAFAKSFGAKPKVITSAEGAVSAELTTYIESTNTNFSLGILNSLKPNKTYKFSYIVVE